MTLFEGLDTDPMLLGQESERCYEPLVDNPILQIARRLWSRTEVRALQKLAHLGAIRHDVLTLQGTEIPQSPADARRAGRGEIHSLNTSTSGEQRGAEEQCRSCDRPPEPQKDGALSHLTIL